MSYIFADVILYDNIGISYTGNTIYESGMGGSEFQSILLLEELVKLGKRVICLNNTKVDVEVNGVMYIPNIWLDTYKFKCNNLIIHRYSDIPKIPHKKAFVWATDLNGVHNLKFYSLFEQNRLELVVLSNFHNKLFPDGWKKHTIHFMIPSWVYGYKVPVKKCGYIYASSLIKGYSSTYECWKYLKGIDLIKNDQLYVCLPGYDNLTVDISDKLYSINYLSTLPFKQVVETISMCKGMFYVNILPESFGISVVLAEILQTTPYVYGINGLGALPELINSPSITTNMDTFINYFKTDNVSSHPANVFNSTNMVNNWIKILHV